MDVKFIRDDTEEKAVKELQGILDVLSVREKTLDVYAARRFMIAMLAACRKEEPQKMQQYVPSQLVVAKPSFKDKFKKAVGIANKPVPIPGPIPIPAPREVKVIKAEEKEKEEDVPLPPKEEIHDFSKPFTAYERGYPMTLARDKQGVALVVSSLENTQGGMLYKLVEPAVDAKVLSITKDRIFKAVKKKPQTFDDEKFMTKNITKAMKKAKVQYSEDYADKLKYYLRRDILGLGKIDAFLQDPHINSIVCDGYSKPLKIVFPEGEIATNVTFLSAEELNSFVKDLAEKMGIKVGKDTSGFDGKYNGWTVQATVGFGNISSKFVIKKIITFI